MGIAEHACPGYHHPSRTAPPPVQFLVQHDVRRTCRDGNPPLSKRRLRMDCGDFLQPRLCCPLPRVAPCHLVPPHTRLLECHADTRMEWKDLVLQVEGYRLRVCHHPHGVLRHRRPGLRFQVRTKSLLLPLLTFSHTLISNYHD